jgi:hypothetical protein
MTTVPAATQVAGLSTAAALLDPQGRSSVDIDMDGARIVLPAAAAEPLRYLLLASADAIAETGHSLGLAVSYQLQIAGVIVGMDLGHNR